jgi:hypothetical protein
MQNAVGPFYNLDFYFQKLAMLLERYFDKSSIPSKLINIRTNNKGEIVGWDIDKTKLKFNDCNCSLYVREKAIVDRETWSLMFFSYHYEPSKKETHMSFRVDLDSVSLHGNPDERFSKIKHLMNPEHIKLKLNRFNLIAAIYISYKYKNNTLKYPFDNDYCEEYNQIIDTCLKGGEKNDY